MTTSFRFVRRAAATSAIYRQVFLLLAGATCALSPTAAWAQAANIVNLQSTLQTFTIPPSAMQPARLGPKDGLALDKCRSRNDPAVMNKALESRKRKDPTATAAYYVDHPDQFEPDFIEAQKADLARKRRQNPELVGPPVNPNYACHTAQPINVTLNVPFNPTWESNVLRNPANNSPGFSLGFGAAAMITTPGVAGSPLDLVSYGVSSASARYPSFLSKSLDSVTEQAAYQMFLEGFYYPDGKQSLTEFDQKRIPKDLPAGNLITYDTLSFGVQNQTAFLPGLRPETADLFTPQVMLARSNISLLGSSPSNVCDPNPPKPGVVPGKSDTAGFCYYIDLSLTAGQTLSDVPTQQNANLVASVTPGWRIDQTDWKLTLPTVVTSRFYNDVVGGRSDVLFQIGPNLSYSKPAMGPGGPFVSFSITATYNQNFSTLSTASWRGVIIQPTLTIAFIPQSPPK